MKARGLFAVVFGLPFALLFFWIAAESWPPARDDLLPFSAPLQSWEKVQGGDLLLRLEGEAPVFRYVTPVRHGHPKVMAALEGSPASVTVLAAPGEQFVIWSLTVDGVSLSTYEGRRWGAERESYLLGLVGVGFLFAVAYLANFVSYRVAPTSEGLRRSSWYKGTRVIPWSAVVRVRYEPESAAFRIIAPPHDPLYVFSALAQRETLQGYFEAQLADEVWREALEFAEGHQEAIRNGQGRQYLLSRGRSQGRSRDGRGKAET